MSKDQKLENIKEQISDNLELPKEITLSFPKITIIGNTQLRVENHRGIIEYTSFKIRINTKIGILVITGDGLFIRNIIKEEIVVEGRIKSLDIDE